MVADVHGGFQSPSRSWPVSAAVIITCKSPYQSRTVAKHSPPVLAQQHYRPAIAACSPVRVSGGGPWNRSVIPRRSR